MAKLREISFLSEHGLKEDVSRLSFSTFLPLRPNLMSFHLPAVHSQELKSQIITRIFSSTLCTHTDSPVRCLLTYTQFLTLLKMFSQAETFLVPAPSRFIHWYICQCSWTTANTHISYLHSWGWASWTQILYRFYLFKKIFFLKFRLNIWRCLVVFLLMDGNSTRNPTKCKIFVRISIQAEYFMIFVSKLFSDCILCLKTVKSVGKEFIIES